MLPPVRSAVGPGMALRAAAATLLGSERGEDVARELSDRYSASYAVLTGSGTDALLLGLRISLLRRPGSRRVALPAYGCFAMATAAVGADCEVDFYDLDPDTLTPDLASLDAALERGARTVVVAHLYGYPADVAAVVARAHRTGAVVIEDAAQAAGGELHGQALGRFGDLSVLSFGRGKGRSCGGGGALLARGAGFEAMARDAGRALASSGRSWGARALIVALGQWALGRPGLYRLPASLTFLGLGETRYVEPREPRPMPAFPLELLRLQMRDGDGSELETRRRNAGVLRCALAGARGARPVTPLAGARSGELRLPIRVPPRLRADARALGVVPGYPSLLGDLPEVRSRLCPDAAATPGAEDLVRSLVTLPTHGGLRAADVRAIQGWAGGSAARSAAPPARSVSLA